MRLFVAVAISDEARDEAVRVTEHLRREFGSGVAARWVEPDNLHLTVRFIGDVADRDVPAVLTALQRPVPIEPFEIVFGTCGVFPPGGPPRVIWIGLRQGLEPLTRMHEEFNRRLQPLGFIAEKRAFSAHLTLARVKISTAAVRRTVGETAVRAICSEVTRATVFRSAPSPQGARYSRLLEVDCLPSTAC